MPDYSLGKVYKIWSPSTELVYIGSTCCPRLAQRLRQHTNSYNRWRQIGKGSNMGSFVLIELGDHTIELLEDFPCANSDQLRAREQHYIREHANTSNKVKAFVTPYEARVAKSEYYQNDRDRFCAKAVEYRQQNKEAVKVVKAAHYERNRDAIIAKNTEYRQQNKEAVRARKAAHYERNRVTILAKAADYHAANRETLSVRRMRPYTCACGSVTGVANKMQHEHTKKHQAYLETRRALLAQCIAVYGDEDWDTFTLADMRECLEGV